MTRFTLHYVHDPLCGWCYAASPMVEAVANAGVRVMLHGGGLWDRPTYVDPTKRDVIRQADARIASLAGVPFGPRYLDRLMSDCATVFWSRPVVAAILAANGIDNGADLRMLRAIQHAHYVDGLKVVETSVLSELARTLGMEAEAFSRALSVAAVDEHIASSRNLMALAGLHGFPGFLVERDGNLTSIRHESFYGRPVAFAHAVMGGE